MLLSEATGAGLGLLAHKRSPHPLKPGEWRAGDQGENLFVGCQSPHCTAVLYSDSSLTAATQLGPAEPAASE